MRQLRFAAGWTMAERMLADDAEGDVLAIFDAVYATKVKRDIRSGNTRTFQVLAATGYNRSPIELRLQSFTASLIKVLKQSVNVEWDEPSITIYKLGEMIDRQEEPPETPCLIHTILKGSQQCISLGPLAPRPQDRLEFGALASERWKHATLVVRAIVKLRRRAVRSLARRRWKRAMLAVRTVVRWRIYIQQRDRLAPRLTQEAEEKAREEEKKKERERIRTENEEWERRRR
ncbi:hypothetical protein W97_04023 [Coniosporium apollinis CBS 100218]|uniref:Uncharacterized protein n=1 Tax=Coniosporium apollinis (strain CBS 100218) TaxID=1168221 RepID=R7YSA8_CONA1|nr:uncharacterized protein W97_04023 [Coniosporium apollinis CBS 100218]EON64790.1 hypothetical protein W97_04023 [Coniosporium apollinis CBS 100218]